METKLAKAAETKKKAEDNLSKAKGQHGKLQAQVTLYSDAELEKLNGEVDALQKEQEATSGLALEAGKLARAKKTELKAVLKKLNKHRGKPDEATYKEAWDTAKEAFDTAKQQHSMARKKSELAKQQHNSKRSVYEAAIAIPAHTKE